MIFTAYGSIDKAVQKMNVSDKDFIIAADYGYLKTKELNIIPDIVIGDMDSVNVEALPEEIEFIKFDPIKDDTDTLLAIKEGINRGYKDFVLLGGLGGRLDHTFANIQCVKYIKRLGGNCVITDNDSFCTLIKNETFVAFPGYKYLSLFCLNNSASGITITGFKYPLTDATISDWFPIGVSNEIVADKGKITVSDGEIFLIQTN